MGNGPESNSTFSTPRKKKRAWLSARLHELGICILVHRAGLKEGATSVFESLNKKRAWLFGRLYYYGAFLKNFLNLDFS